MNNSNKKKQYKIFTSLKKLTDKDANTFITNLYNLIKQGGVENNIPEKLQQIFPQETFLYPRTLPGIYVIYFPEFNKVYVGESQNVKKRVIKQIKDFNVSGSLALNLYLKQSNFNYKIYALYQGPKCTQKFRKTLEKKFIKQSGENSINIVSNANKVYDSLIKYPKTPNLSILPMETNISWINFNLPYKKVDYNSGEKVIYAVINKDSKRLYIGQTGLYPLEKRMKFHYNALQKILALKASGITTRPSAHTRMAEDIQKGQNTFYYSSIKNINKVSITQVLEIEKSVIVQALSLHKQDLYNIVNKKIYPGSTVGNIKKTTIKKSLIINPFVINGSWYDTSLEAMSAAGVSNYQTLKLRSESFNFPNIISIKKPVGKSLPLTKEIKSKVDEYYRRYGPPTTNGTILTFEKALTESVSPRYLSPYIYQGKWYDSKQEAAAEAKKQGISFGSFTWRTRSPFHPDVISIRNPYGKQLPNTPEIKAKLEEMNRYEQAYYQRRPSRRQKKINQRILKNEKNTKNGID